MSVELVRTGIVTRCCISHHMNTGAHLLSACCGPEDCGPCCKDCPTCPTLYAARMGLTKEVSLDHDRSRIDSSTGPIVVDMIVRGPAGVVVLTVHAGWDMVPFVPGATHLGASKGGPLARSVSIHAEDVGELDPDAMRCEICDYLDGRPCRHDASLVGSETAARILIERGPAPMWGHLYGWYREHLGDGTLDVLDIPPLVPGLEAHLYVVGFANGTVKVGMTERPLRRLSNHRSNARSFGTSVVKTWISPPHVSASANESRLIGLCRDACGITDRRRGEYFPISFESAVRFAETLPFARGDRIAFQRRNEEFSEALRSMVLGGGSWTTR